MPEPIAIDDQPIDATFFGEGRWLTDFITPHALEVETLYQQLTGGIRAVESKIAACWSWVASEIKYTQFVKAKMSVNGKVASQDDYWQTPSQAIRTKIGNCSNKAFLLTSLLRNALPSDQVFCVLGNLYNGKPGGHAWTQVRLDSTDYVLESTTPKVPAMVPAESLDRYEAVHFFNDEKIYSIEGRTVMIPMTKCYSEWLADYLDWAYIEWQRSKT